jgi:hypothetical protein
LALKTTNCSSGRSSAGAPKRLPRNVEYRPVVEERARWRHLAEVGHRAELLVVALAIVL